MNKKLKILICGGYGFLGSDFIRYMLDKHRDISIVNYDKLTYTANPYNLLTVKNDKRYSFIKGDIVDHKKLDKIFKKFRPEYLINFAAETDVDTSIYGDGRAFIHTNISGVKTLLELMNKNKFVKKYLQTSTDEVYGDTVINSKVNFTEDSPLRPSNPYSVSKATGDMLCFSYYRTYRTPIIITRSGNNMGPYQYPEKFIPYSLIRLSQNKKIPIYGTGEHIRNWVYASDNSRGIEVALLKGEIGNAYNISAGQYRDVNEVAKNILEYKNMPLDFVIHVPDRPGNDFRYAPDGAKLWKLGFKPQYTFEIALKTTIDWYEDPQNKKWFEDIKKKFKKINEDYFK